jgi:hypothetical protein
MPDSTDLKVVGEQLPFPWGGVSASRGAPEEGSFPSLAAPRSQSASDQRSRRSAVCGTVALIAPKEQDKGYGAAFFCSSSVRRYTSSLIFSSAR